MHYQRKDMSIDKCEKATDLPWDLFPGNVMLKYPFWNIDFLFITEDSKSESKQCSICLAFLMNVSI